MTPKEYLDEAKRVVANEPVAAGTEGTKALSDVMDLITMLELLESDDFDLSEEFEDPYSIYEHDWAILVTQTDVTPANELILKGIEPLVRILRNELVNQTKLNQLK